MNKSRVIFGSIGILIIFALIGGGNVLKNVTSEPPKSVIVSTPSANVKGVTLTQQQIVGSYFAPNQTQAIQQIVQNQVLTSVVQSPPDESFLNLNVEKINSIGTIVDRLDFKIVNLFDVAAGGQGLPDLANGKLRISLNFESKQPNIPVNLSGTMKISVNDVEITTKPITVTGDSGGSKSKTVTIDEGLFYDIPLEKEKLNLKVGINKLTISFSSISGSMGTKTVNKNNLVVYESKIQYSPELKVYITDENIQNAIYPSGESTVSFSTTGSPYTLYVPTAEMCFSRTYFSYSPCNYYPVEQQAQPIIVKGLSVKDSSTNELLLNIPELKNKETVNLKRGHSYLITIQDPASSWTIQTPSDASITYDYSCVTSGTSGQTTTNISTICGHS